MLKCCVRPLITLVLALVATGVLSTLCPAREFRSPAGSPTAHVTASAKPRPIATSGEPDQPLSPPPVRNSGIMVPPPADGNADIEFVIRRAGLIWAFWLTRAVL